MKQIHVSSFNFANHTFTALVSFNPLFVVLCVPSILLEIIEGFNGHPVIEASFDLINRQVDGGFSRLTKKNFDRPTQLVGL